MVIRTSGSWVFSFLRRSRSQDCAVEAFPEDYAESPLPRKLIAVAPVITF
jgi:hypothetical protein